MRLEIFEKSEILGPTILIDKVKIVVALRIFRKSEFFHFSKISKKFKNLRNYISYILINNK